MAGKVVSEIRTKSEAALARLARQLDGMDACMDRADAPGQWTTRDVLAHLLGEPGWDPLQTLKTFSHQNFPTIDVSTGKVVMTVERRTMTTKQFVDALERRRQKMLGYLEGLPDAELTGRKARIPLFKQLMGTDEVPLQVFVGTLLDLHWNDHAAQLAKIRAAVGLPEVS